MIMDRRYAGYGMDDLLHSGQPDDSPPYGARLRSFIPVCRNGSFRVDPVSILVLVQSKGGL